MRVVFVHGACVVDAGWWWRRMVEPLALLGLGSAAVELPSCGRSAGRLGDLYADVDAVRAELRISDEPTVLCGHSYGGMVVTGAAAGEPSVRRLVYVSSMLPDEGESLADLADPTAPAWLAPAGDGTVRISPALTEADVRAHFLNDCDEDASRGAIERLARQSAAAFGQPIRAAGWRETPSTYVVCADDRATEPARQRAFAKRAAEVLELDAGHHPFLSRPEELAAVIAAVAFR